MKDILKFTIAILIAMSIHSHWMRDKKKPSASKAGCFRPRES